MKDRIDRRDDENLYQPKIHSDRIRDLHKIGMETGLPMTVLIDYAIRSYINAYVDEKRKEQEAKLDAQERMDTEFQERQRDFLDDDSNFLADFDTFFDYEP